MSPFQMIAASATMRDPERHLKALTGEHFWSVSERDNGAPFAGLHVLHVESPAVGAAGEKALASAIRALSDAADGHGMIAFADTRQGVEHITNYVGSAAFSPYRGGYAPDDRRRIEAQMRAGKGEGCCSTSALEVGIDMPFFTIGLNLSIPQSRKAFRQRVGRVGRASPGVFAIYAPAPAFAQLGTTLEEFFEGEVEPSLLYLENSILQFKHALCLAEEVDDPLAAIAAANIDCPAGFDKMVAAALPGGLRPRAVEQITWAAGNSPHHAFPLRDHAQDELKLVLAGASRTAIGTISLNKALREAAPGMTYLHLRRAYRVVDWRIRPHERIILLERTGTRERTQPMWHASVTASSDASEILDGHRMIGPSGSLVELCLQANEMVEGFLLAGKPFPYRELVKTDKRMRRQHRQLSTTGVLVRIAEPWFKGGDETQIAVRRQVAKAFRTILSRECSVAPADIKSAYNAIALHDAIAPQKLDDAIVIFDNVNGGLRLSAPLFTRLPDLLIKLARAAELAGSDAVIDAHTVGRLQDWYAGLHQEAIASSASEGITAEDGEVIVFAPGSEVRVRIRGALFERTLLEPQLLQVGDTEQLMYRYEDASGANGWVSHDHIEPLGHDWRRAAWSPTTNALRELA